MTRVTYTILLLYSISSYEITSEPRALQLLWIRKDMMRVCIDTNQKMPAKVLILIFLPIPTTGMHFEEVNPNTSGLKLTVKHYLLSNSQCMLKSNGVFLLVTVSTSCLNDMSQFISPSQTRNTGDQLSRNY